MSEEEEESNKQDITFTITNQSRVLDINCIADIEIPETAEAVHFSDVVAGAVLERIKVFDQGKVPPGKYTLKMTAILTPVTKDTKSEISESED